MVQVKMILPARLVRLVGATLLSLLLFASPAAAQKIPVNVSLDVVEAMKVFGVWVQNGFTTWDKNKQKVVADAVPNVATDLVALAVVKRQLAVSVTELARGQSSAAGAVRAETAEFQTYLASLKKHLAAIDPNWRLNNIETTSALYQVQVARGGNERRLLEIVKSSSSGKLEYTDTVEVYEIRNFAARQAAEADQLDALAKSLRDIARKRGAK